MYCHFCRIRGLTFNEVRMKNVRFVWQNESENLYLHYLSRAYCRATDRFVLCGGH